MKFKTIFIIFNSIIGISFLILFILPFLFLDISQFSIIFSTNWIILCIFLLFIIIFNTYFIKNWKLFKLIEQENWEKLIIFIEKKVYDNKKYSKNLLKILINCYIVTSKLDSIQRLYEYLKNNNEKLIYKFPLEFGITFLLKNTPEESEMFFKGLLEHGNLKEKLWIKWNYAFSLMRLNKNEESKAVFSEILNEKTDHVLKLLTLYMYFPLVKNNPDEMNNVIFKADEFLNQFSINSWEKYLENEKKNIQAVILSKIVSDASNWVFNLKDLNKNETIQ
jgi:hypothetical protein